VGVLVLNTCGEPLHTVSANHAIRMILRKVATIPEPDTTFGTFPRPRVVRLTRYVVTTWRYTRPPRWSRRGVLVRDGHTCGYCGGYADTVDHIVPISRGGERTSWLNTVACCGGTRRSCNARKGDRLPREAGLKLRHTPFVPTWNQINRNVA
jgi:5-methylcytosine-specific restriction endonuclease McrA